MGSRGANLLNYVFQSQTQSPDVHFHSHFLLRHQEETGVFNGLHTVDDLFKGLSNSWIIHILWSYIAINRTPNIDCYWVGAVPKV